MAYGRRFLLPVLVAVGAVVALLGGLPVAGASVGVRSSSAATVTLAPAVSVTSASRAMRSTASWKQRSTGGAHASHVRAAPAHLTGDHAQLAGVAIEHVGIGSPVLLGQLSYDRERLADGRGGITAVQRGPPAFR